MKTFTETVMPTHTNMHSDLAKLIAHSETIDTANRALTGGDPSRCPHGVTWDGNHISCIICIGDEPPSASIAPLRLTQWRHVDWHALFTRVAAFQSTRFPNQSAESKANHLKKEIDEVLANPGDIIEHADCLILVFGIAAKCGHGLDDLLEAAHRKMKINEQRAWEPADADGVHHHKES